MSWFYWLLVVLFVLSMWLSLADVAHPRSRTPKPITSSFGAIIDVLLIFGLLYYGGMI